MVASLPTIPTSTHVPELLPVPPNPAHSPLDTDATTTQEWHRPSGPCHFVVLQIQVSCHRIQDNSQPYLCCRYHPERQPQYSLIKTPLSQRLDQDVRVFIGNFNSIPAFTANYTMTLFQQSTAGA